MPGARSFGSGARRRVWAAVALVTALAGCSPSPAATPEPANVTPAPVQELRLALGDDPYLRSGAATNVGLSNAGPSLGIFETLTSLTPRFGTAPGLALRWEQLDARRWRFHLRPGVRFHNGAPLDATAAAATLDDVARRQVRPLGLEPGSATAAGPLVLDVALRAANARLPEQLANPAYGVRAPGTESGDGSSPSRTPTGTGPFRFSSYRPGMELRVEAHDGYWGRRARLRSIVYRFGPPADASRLLALRQVDAVGLVAPEHLARVSGRTDRLVRSEPAQAAYVLLNVGGAGRWGRLRDEGLRRAVAAAVDAGAVRDAAWPELAEPNPTLVPPLVLGEGARRAPAEDGPERAQDLLERSGWVPGPDGVRARSGERLELTLVAPADQKRAADELRAQLGRVGVAVTVDSPDRAAALTRVNQAAFDLFLELRHQEDANPCALCRFFSIRPGGQLTVAGAAHAGPDADAAFDASFTAASADTARRLARQLMQVVTDEQVVALPLAALRTPWLVSTRVQGFAPAPLPAAQRWDDVWLAL